MKVFVDTNVILDVLQRRTEFLHHSMDVLQMGISQDVEIMASPLTFATCHYILRKEHGKQFALQCLQSIKSFVTMTMMDDEQGARALNSNMPDFEDMLQYESASAANCNVIVTRNGKHFPKDNIPILTPTEFLEQYTE